jgi:hypothetical protein
MSKSVGLTFQILVIYLLSVGRSAEQRPVGKMGRLVQPALGGERSCFQLGSLPGRRPTAILRGPLRARLRPGTVKVCARSDTGPYCRTYVVAAFEL